MKCALNIAQWYSTKYAIDWNTVQKMRYRLALDLGSTSLWLGHGATRQLGVCVIADS
jgi:hypothetical protein